MKPLFYIDGRGYHVGVTSIKRGAQIKDGPNGTAVRSGRMVRDMVGTYYDYTLELSTFDMDRAEYDALYEVLTAPVDSHFVTAPYGQGTLAFEAYITGVDDVLEDMDEAGSGVWGQLSVTFFSIEPIRRP